MSLVVLTQWQIKINIDPDSLQLIKVHLEKDYIKLRELHLIKVITALKGQIKTNACKEVWAKIFIIIKPKVEIAIQENLNKRKTNLQKATWTTEVKIIDQQIALFR